MHRNLRFLKTAIKDYRVGALSVSSKYVVRHLLSRMPRGFRWVVEYGAGDGVITREILKILPEDGLLIAIEINPEFFMELRKIKDKCFRAMKGDAVHLSKRLNAFGLPQIDAVVSGIPFSFIQPELRRKIVENTYRAIAPGGVFLMYQHSLWALPLLKEKFCRVEVSFEPRNFLPYFVFRAVK